MPRVWRGAGGVQRLRRSASRRVDLLRREPPLARADDGQAALGDVDLDQVALLDQRERAAVQRLGRDVADRRALRRAGVAPVGDDGAGGGQLRCSRR